MYHTSKILIREETGYKIYGNPLDYILPNFSTNVAKSCLTLGPPWSMACQASLSMDFSSQGYWCGLQFPPPGNLPNPGIKPAFLASLALAGRFCVTVIYCSVTNYPKPGGLK